MRRAIPFLIAMLMTAGGVPAEVSEENVSREVRENVPENAGESVTEGDADEAKAEQGPGSQGPKMVSGMSILGNQEAPKSLVIVPWKSSEIGDSLAVSTVLDDSRMPIDRDVFLRELSYYEIRSGGKP